MAHVAMTTPAPSAAALLREAMPETLTILRLAVPSTLVRTLRSAYPSNP